MSSLPDHATAWRIHKTGLPPVTLQKEEIPVPKPGEGQLLIEVHASSLNPVDWKIAALAPSLIQQLPRTLASDFSGVVVGHGPGLTAEQQAQLAVGKRVLGINDAAAVAWGKFPGTLATHIVTSTSTVAPLPDRLSFTQGAAIPLTALTAFALSHYAKAGDRVLVVGGSTSVGLFLTQQLKLRGASHVTATASGQKAEVVTSLGADEVIDYRATKVIDELAHVHSVHSNAAFDLVLDCVGDLDLFYASDKFLKPKGVYANVGASELAPNYTWGDRFAFLWSRIKLHLPTFISGAPRTYKEEAIKATEMPTLAATMLSVDESKAIKPVIDSTYSFDQAKDAYQRLMTGRALGKIVVEVQ